MRTQSGLYVARQQLDLFGSPGETQEWQHFALEAGGDSKITTMNDCLKYYPVKGLKFEPVKNSKGEVQYVNPNAAEDEEKIPKMGYSDAIVDKTVVKNPKINQGIEPDRYSNPHLSALVMQHPKASISARGFEHLPIFFNAIPPIEMARCTPYIDIKILTQNYDDTKPPSLNNVSFMRFSKRGASFELDDMQGFGNLKPVAEETSDSEREAKENVNIAYMDLFTSPQTMANANINSKLAGLDDKLSIKDFFGKTVNDDPILEPIAPFLTLKDLTISITGAGFGIMASKRGQLSLVLHDRSRLRELAPLVSTSQFATTRIMIEFGWNHPEGGPNSNNTIGKYLNNLKETAIYQVVKCDYDFSDGSAVGLKIGLAAYGYRQAERVHCGAGPEVPLNSLHEYIENAVENLLEANSKKEGKEKTKAPEVRQKIKLKQRSARSINTCISFESYKTIMQLLKPKTATSGQTTNESKGLIKVIGILLNAETIINVEEKKKFLEAQEKTLKKDGEKKAFKILKRSRLV